MKTRELEKVKMIIFEALGLDLGYAYDDLVFSEHGALIIQFDENDNRKLYGYFNIECFEDERLSMFEKLKTSAEKKGFDLSDGGQFNMEQLADKDEIKIEFILND
jgi:hypothetical protein